MKNKKTNSKNKTKAKNNKKANIKVKNKSINNLTEANAYGYIKKARKKIFTYEFMKEKCSLWGKGNGFMRHYSKQEKFLNKLFCEKKYKNNKNYDTVFIKVKILDSFYSTNLKEGLEDMVNNILKIDFDSLVKQNNIEPYILVNKIKKVKSTLSDSKDCISFASKYCNRYNKSKYPIYDKHVKKMLIYINKATNFLEDNESNKHDNRPAGKRCIKKTKKDITMASMDDYKTYCQVVERFRNKFNKDNNGHVINYKKMDRYIWTWAKEILFKLNTKRKRQIK